MWATSTNAIVLDDNETCNSVWLAGTCDKYCAEDVSHIPSDCRGRGEALTRAAVGGELAGRVAQVLSCAAAT